MVEEASVARGPGDGAQQTHAVDHAFGVRSVTGGDPRRERLRQRPDTRRRSHTLDEWEPSNRVEQRGGGDWTTPLQFNLRLEDARRMRPARFSLEIGKAPQDARGVQRAIEPPLFAQAYREQPVCVELAQPPSGRLVGLYVEHLFRCGVVANANEMCGAKREGYVVRQIRCPEDGVDFGCSTLPVEHGQQSGGRVHKSWLHLQPPARGTFGGVERVGENEHAHQRSERITSGAGELPRANDRRVHRHRALKLGATGRELTLAQQCDAEREMATDFRREACGQCLGDRAQRYGADTKGPVGGDGESLPFGSARRELLGALHPIEPFVHAGGRCRERALIRGKREE
jgi:hypothetical protein